MVNSKSIVCISAGLPQDVRHYVRALADAGLLRRFVTSWSFHRDGMLSRLLQTVDRYFATDLGARFAQRAVNEVPLECLSPAFWPEFRYRLERRLGLSGMAEAFDAHGRDLTRTVVSQLSEGVRLVVAREDACLSVFRAAGRQGIKRLLDLPIVYYETLRAALEAEHARYPGATTEPPPAAEFSIPRMRRKRDELDAADAVVIASRFVRDSLPVEKARVATVIPYGCEPGPEPVPYSARPNLVLCVGHLSLRKGTPRLLAAWKRLGAYRTHTLRLVGRQLLTDRFLADYSGMYEYVPPQPHLQLKAHYAAARIFAFPSVGDGFGLVINESLSAGVPVVVSDHTGAPGYLETGREGVIYPSDSDEQLAAGLDRLLSRPTEGAEMARMAYETAQRWTWADYRKRFETLVRDLVAG